MAGVIVLAALAFAAYRFHRQKLARTEDGLHEIQQGPKVQELQATKSIRYHELPNTSEPQELEGSAMGEQGAEAPTHKLDQKERRDEE